MKSPAARVRPPRRPVLETGPAGPSFSGAVLGAPERPREGNPLSSSPQARLGASATPTTTRPGVLGDLLPSADQGTRLKRGSLIPRGAMRLEGGRPLGQINFLQAAPGQTGWHIDGSSTARVSTASGRLQPFPALLGGFPPPEFGSHGRTRAAPLSEQAASPMGSTPFPCPWVPRGSEIILEAIWTV